MMDTPDCRLPQRAHAVSAATPLWQIAPTRDSDGRPLCDFMMLIPRLRNRPPADIDETFRLIHAVLGRYEEVVFANMNLTLNVLWVSLRYRHGLVLELAGAIRYHVPEAVLVAHQRE